MANVLSTLQTGANAVNISAMYAAYKLSGGTLSLNQWYSTFFAPPAPTGPYQPAGPPKDLFYPNSQPVSDMPSSPNSMTPVIA